MDAQIIKVYIHFLKKQRGSTLRNDLSTYEVIVQGSRLLDYLIREVKCVEVWKGVRGGWMSLQDTTCDK